MDTKQTSIKPCPMGLECSLTCDIVEDHCLNFHFCESQTSAWEMPFIRSNLWIDDSGAIVENCPHTVVVNPYLRHHDFKRKSYEKNMEEAGWAVAIPIPINGMNGGIEVQLYSDALDAEFSTGVIPCRESERDDLYCSLGFSEAIYLPLQEFEGESGFKFKAVMLSVRHKDWATYGWAEAEYLPEVDPIPF
ncbi:MAG: hypothetical protein F6K40_12440 [Okeania sp. SIO3I5]|uniref:hypothetical protein n=1 Tax=Okeania sp. SIO3I5 TaxID=2607805 RepID=UPI0013B6A2BC|nr:hypothetical protein [Okeania sp. SIO3I5]NEQ37038.1 hypothetical protein [Okeania sp. SIO3I5]